VIEQAIIVAGTVGLVVLLFAGLAIRTAWQWLTRGTWGNVVTLVEGKALSRK
jgi:hypothetical protein